VLPQEQSGETSSSSKKLFAWDSGLLILCLYLLGFAFWGAALFFDHFKPLFGTAAILFIVGFFRAYRWLRQHEFFRRSRSRRRFSDTNPDVEDKQAYEFAKKNFERRRRGSIKKRKSLRALALAICTCVSLVIIVGLFKSFQFLAEKKKPRIEVFLSDAERVEAMPTPFLGKTVYSWEMIFASIGLPTKYVPIRAGQDTIKMDVILRDTGGVDLKNVRIKVESNLPFKSVAGGLALVAKTDPDIQASGTELDTTVEQMRPYAHHLEEHVFTVEIPVPKNQDRAGIFIAAEGDNLPPFSAAMKIWFVRDYQTNQPSVSFATPASSDKPAPAPAP
jgi:hypothetical protein